MPDQSFTMPPPQRTRSAWRGDDLADRPQDWTIRLSPDHIAELRSAAGCAGGAGLDQITRENFALPSLGPLLSDLREDLVGGLGFALIHGLQADRYSEEEAATIFFGLGAHIGNARSQNAAGELLGHVRDIGAAGTDTRARIYQTSERQTFHTDSSDVVGLLCLKTAKTGGASMLVSAATIYNEFLERRPDLLPCLFDPIATDRRGEVPEGMKPWFEIPVFTWHLARLSVMYQRQYIDSAQRFPDAPRLTARHVEALDLFDDLANDPALHLAMALAPGDMQFVHNHSLLHDRTGFEDWPEPERRRHLLRLWLSVPGDRPLPDSFAERFGAVTIGDRGGIVVSR